MCKLSTQSIRSRNFLTLSLSGHSVFVIVDLSFFNTTNEKGFLLCTKHCTRKSSPSIFSIQIGVLVFFLRKENYKVYTNSQESFPKLTIPQFFQKDLELSNNMFTFVKVYVFSYAVQPISYFIKQSAYYQKSRILLWKSLFHLTSVTSLK